MRKLRLAMRAAERAADVRALGTALRYNSSLTELELASAPLETFEPEDMRTLAEGIRAHGAFAAVTLDGKTIPIHLTRGPQAAVSIDLSSHDLGEISGLTLSAILRANTTLKSLRLAKNRLQATGAQPIVEALEHAPLKLLDLSQNGLGLREPGAAVGRAPTMVLGAAGSVLSAASAAAESTADSMAPPMGSVQSLFVAVSKMTHLETLNLDENELSSSYDLEVICRLRSLEHLSLQRNQLQELPSKIGTLFALKELNLQSNQLTRLQGSIGTLTKLRSLNLRANHLTQLTPAIGNLSALRKLDISDNAKLRTLPRDMINLHHDLELLAQRDRHLVPLLGTSLTGGVPALKKYFAEHPEDEGSFVRQQKGDDGGPRRNGKGLKREPNARPKRPTQRPLKEGLSRHYHVSDVGHVVLLYNCCGAAHVLSDEHVAIPGDREIDLVTVNDDVVGKLLPRASAKQSPEKHRFESRELLNVNDDLERRLQLKNEWHMIDDERQLASVR